ncbi:MAG: hypothetical protein HOC20_09975 [Chloroflexi bacterium]|jgi:hypothetical protein|nr:hypothetical protein [Chloroflexota bacterium]
MLTTLNTTDIEIDRNAVCRYIGYTDGVEPSPRISSLLDEYIENAMHLIEPSYAYLFKGIDDANEDVAFLEDSIVFEGTVVGRLAQQSEKIAIFVLTIGDRLEEMAAKLANDGMIVESYVLDAIGSSAVENLAEFVQGVIGEVAYHYGHSISRRFSPGYCDWHISQQEMLFRAIDGNESSVMLSEGYLMTPQKSISGIIGIGKRDCGITKYNPCKTCERRNCVGRR